jgi:hypothetical protein
MAITEADAKPYENQRVTLTLVDGTKIKGFLSGVGYAGLRLMVHGSERPYGFRMIKSVKGRDG